MVRNGLYGPVGNTPSTVLDEKGPLVPGRNPPDGLRNKHDILTGTNMDGTVATGSTCNSGTSAAAGKACVGHFDPSRGGDPTATTNATSWNSSHDSSGCSAASLVMTGGAGRIYCFATN